MAFEDYNEEKARERRIVERRERVQERLRVQQQRAKQGGGLVAGGAEQQAACKGKQQAQQSAEAVRQLLQQAQTALEAVQHKADQRSEQHREACDVEEAALREQVAAEAEDSRRENRGIDLEWEQLQGVLNPQELHAGILAVSAHCKRVLESKDGVLGAIKALLQQRDEQYVKLLRAQGEETDGLIGTLHSEHDSFKAAQEQQLEEVEAAYLQERRELLAAQKAELDSLLEKRSALEQEFMEQYLAACEQYENELERMRVEGLQEHGVLKRRLESEVASLETHLDGIKAAYMLNTDKLDYNYRVLVEREQESKDALMQQKRKITRQWEVLNRLKKRYAALDGRAAADNTRLSDEYQAVTRAFNHLQSKFRHFKAADLTRFDKIRDMKEEELGELLEQLLEAEQFISGYVVGLPHPETASRGCDDATSGSDGGSLSDEAEAGSGLGLMELALVGTAVVVDPRAAAAAEAAAFGPDGAPAEVVAVSASEAARHAQLIPAYHPGGAADVADSSSLSSWGAAGRATGGGGGAELAVTDIEALAGQELKESADSGALSLLLTDSKQLHSQRVQQLLAQVPTAVAAGAGGWAGVDGQRLTAEAVARSLGLHHRSTVATLQLLFAAGSSRSSGSMGPDAASNGAMAETIRPRDADAEAEAGGSSGSSPGATAAAAEPAPTFSIGQVEQGLGRLMRLLGAAGDASSAGQAGPTRGGGRGAAAAVAAPAAAASAQPTSKQYWQSRADAALPAGVVRCWGLLEQQATKQFATLQSRTSNADEVLSLRQENERLKASLTALLTSPLNKELQLPPTLLLR